MDSAEQLILDGATKAYSSSRDLPRVPTLPGASLLSPMKAVWSLANDSVPSPSTLVSVGGSMVQWGAKVAPEIIAREATGPFSTASWVAFGLSASAYWAKNIHKMDTLDDARAKGLANDGNGALDSLANLINASSYGANWAYQKSGAEWGLQQTAHGAHWVYQKSGAERGVQAAVKGAGELYDKLRIDPDSPASDGAGTLAAVQNLGSSVGEAAKRIAAGVNEGLNSDTDIVIAGANGLGKAGAKLGSVMSGGLDDATDGAIAAIKGAGNLVQGAARGVYAALGGGAAAPDQPGSPAAMKADMAHHAGPKTHMPARDPHPAVSSNPRVRPIVQHAPT
jgi:hypothetical protein